jgi:hypothetical protein
MPSAHTGTVGIVTADQRGHLAALIGEEGKPNGPRSGIEWPTQGSCEPDALSRGMQAARAMTTAPAGCRDERPRGWRGPAEDRS